MGRVSTEDRIHEKVPRLMTDFNTQITKPKQDANRHIIFNLQNTQVGKSPLKIVPEKEQISPKLYSSTNNFLQDKETQV